MNVPSGVSEDDVIEKIKATFRNVPHNDAYEVDYADIAG
jgi:hypothetical protein